nr:lateral flagellar basal body P-ring FlgIL [uncultured Tolumonas sp.]
MQRILFWCGLLWLALCSQAQSTTHTRPLLDLVDVQGIRENQLVGYGLVVGLPNTGDKAQVKFTSQSMTNMLKQFGVQLPDDIDPKLKNVAAVSVQATLQTISGRGQKVDVTVSSIGDAKSLRGGTLLLTPLRGIDGEVYAVAQGNLIVGGLKADGQSGSSVTVNIPTTGIIPGGAVVEREITSTFNDKPEVTLNLKEPNFRTAHNVEQALNKRLGSGTAKAVSSGRVVMRAPVDPSMRISFMSLLDDIPVEQGRDRPKVVFNSRTGTVVMGQDVRIQKAAVSHGSLTISVQETPQVSQPGPLSNGQTTVTPQSNIAVSQPKGNNMFVWPSGTSLEVIVRAINALGASPDDIMSILQALHEAGALDADLVVI